MKTPDLKPCPFCGGRPYIEKHQRAYVNSESTHVSYVRCMQCGARAERFNHSDYVESHRRASAYSDAVEAWNRRAEAVTLNTLRDAIYEDAVAHGLWEDEQNVQGWPVECAAMIECETDELYEAAREWKDSPVDDNGHFVEELADVIIMCMSVAGKLGIDIDAAVRRKMDINKGRPWKHGKE